MNNKKYAFLGKDKFFDFYGPINGDKEYEDLDAIINKLIAREKWDILFKYIQPYPYNIERKQTKKECLEYLKNKGMNSSLQFVIEQDDEIVLAALKQSLHSIPYIRIKLKKETLIEIDLLYGFQLSKLLVFSSIYKKLLEEASE